VGDYEKPLNSLRSGKRTRYYKMPEVSVVIPSFNGKEFLKVCLPSLGRQTYKDFETIVIDNGSNDGTVEFLESNYPRARLVKNRENLGFAAAVNQGIRVSRGEYIALLNNDTEADKNWLKELVQTLKQRKDISFCASKMLNFYNRKIIDSAGDGWSMRFMQGYNVGKDVEDGPAYSKEKLVFGACAGAALYRKTLFKMIGLLDERFFAYFEDVDLNFRAQLAGLRCLYIPTAVVYHMWSATTQRRNALKRFLTLRNRIIVVLKNMPLPLIVANLKSFTRIAFLAPFRILLEHPKNFYLLFLLYFQLLIWLPSIVRDRLKTQRMRKVSVKELVKALV